MAIIQHDVRRLDRLISDISDASRLDAELARAERRAGRSRKANGPGIEAENIDRIFERFYTDRPGAEDFGQNSGLGLSISRQIAEAHGGTLEAENVLGANGERKGARFILVLPEKGTS
jgi:two-component system sensor histidine kinase ChvG